MHPVFFTIEAFELFGRTFGPLNIHAYGVFLALAFLSGMTLAAREARQYGIKSETVIDMMIYIIICSIIGARIMYVILSYKEYRGDPLGTLEMYNGGLSFHGGAIGGSLAVILFSRWKKISVWTMADVCVPGLVLGAAVARLGCFFNGCCYGCAAQVPWAVVFPNLHDGVPRHPAMLYDMLLHLVLLGALFALKPIRKRKGDLLAFYLIGFSILRFITEIFRKGATGRVFLLDLTMAQWASFGILALGLALFFLRPPDSEMKKET